MPRVSLASSDDLPGEDRRFGTDRIPVNASSTVRPTDFGPRDVVVEDLSSTGFRFRSDERIAVGTMLHLGLAGAGAAQARIVRSQEDSYGCEFIPPLSEDQLRRAFTGTPLLAPAFAGAPRMVVLPYTEDKYPGIARLIVFVGGPIICWGALVGALRLFLR